MFFSSPELRHEFIETIVLTEKWRSQSSMSSLISINFNTNLSIIKGDRGHFSRVLIFPTSNFQNNAFIK
jgi:hypothetical protein